MGVLKIKKTRSKKQAKKRALKNQHRDSLFRGYFKIPENFIYLLEQCKGAPPDLSPGDIKFFSLDSEIAYRLRRNDVSFITSDNKLIILIEHQFTINPNMAFRLFLYFIELLQLWLDKHDINLYGTAKVENLPTAEFYVAYNGKKEIQEETSTFEYECNGMKINVTVQIIDINYDKLKNTDPTNSVAGYSYFYKLFEEQITAGKPPDEAFDTARQSCIKTGYMAGFIEEEAFSVSYKRRIFDYDVQLREESITMGREQGREQGREEGREESIKITKALLQNKPPEQIAAELDLPIEKIIDIQQELFPAVA